MIMINMIPEIIKLALIALSVLCVVAQAIVLIVNYYHHMTDVVKWQENLAEAAILLQIIVLALLLSQTVVNGQGDFLAPSGYTVVRYVILAILMILAIVRQSSRKKIVFIVELIFILMTLPFAEDILGKSFLLVFTIALIFWFTRSLYICFIRSRDIQVGLSGFSIKQAIDALHTGLLFYTPDGTVQLINRRMQRLMIFLTGAIQRNGKNFEKILQNGNTLIEPESITLDGYPVYQLEDGTIWLFSKHELIVYNKKYLQISATDVTERWTLMYVLKKQEEQLKIRGEEIRDVLSNLDETCKGEELIFVRGKVHDIMAQRLAMMMRMLWMEEAIDEESLAAHAKYILKDVWEEVDKGVVTSGVKFLVKEFRALGVQVDIRGSEPVNGKYTTLFTDLVREGVTNAVRHGFATLVTITCNDTPENLLIIIENDGFIAPGEVKEGGGIATIRQRLRKYDGTLNIETKPHFKLIVNIPKVGDGEFDE